MWDVFLLLLVLAGRALSCLRCDQETEELLQDMKLDYITQHVSGGRRNLVEKMRKFLDASVDSLFPTPAPSTGSFTGVTDDVTLFKMSSQLKQILRQLMSENLKDEELFNELVWSMQQLRPDVHEFMAEFSRERYCPNLCGILVQTFIACADCKRSRHTCSKPLNCGERALSVVEDEDLVLDCALVWHRKMELFKDYAFYKLMGRKKMVLSVGPDAILVIKGVALEDTGKYQCDANDSAGNPFSTITYNVTGSCKSTDRDQDRPDPSHVGTREASASSPPRGRAGGSGDQQESHVGRPWGQQCNYSHRLHISLVFLFPEESARGR